MELLLRRAAPSICHTATLPEVCRHRMSVFPSPLKSGGAEELAGAVLVSRKLAGIGTPETSALIRKKPVAPLAVMWGAVATPSASVMAVAVADPLKLALAPGVISSLTL